VHAVVNHTPRKRFGQNFLVDHGVIDAIVAAIDPRPGEHVVEIGPGRGALTAPLLDRLGQLHAVELDRDLCRVLRERFGPDKLVLHQGDALEFDYASLPAPLRVVGNLPYNISTPLLFHLALFAARCRDMHFMLQNEVVERMVAMPSSAAYGRLSVMLQYRFDIERLFGVPPEAFYPVPKVESAIVRLKPMSAQAIAACGKARDERLFARVVTRAFTQRRKTLRNALAGVISAERLQALGIEVGLRPENLSVADFVIIANDCVGDESG
jgi:16S rRNA (adenine1518-N6/adenine1519-N6)-dimethyltransferase